ncbi:MAG: ABC transporter ATP-binding protein [Propionicimonas sp.]
MATIAPVRVATTVILDGVVKNFGKTQVLHDLNLTVRPGELVSLLGPSGCGKTTALRLIAGLEEPSGGVILMNGDDVTGVPTNRRDIGMVFQSYSLFPHLTAIDNTRFGLDMRKVPRHRARSMAAESLELVGLAALADRFPHQLSGGQQQRVALARALVTSPKVLLLDEPLSALDARVRVQLREEILRIQKELGITTVFVTHDQEEALAISDRVAVMREGRIEQIGTPEELYLTPATAEVAAFVGLSSLLPATVTGGVARIWGQAIPVVGSAPDGEYQAFVRPEHFKVAPAGESGMRGIVEASIFLGSARRTELRVAGGELVAVQHDVSLRPERGDEWQLVVEPAPVVVRPLAPPKMTAR